ncbi:hypothetical protein C8R41DRAFT_922784 [Lentinula lateritia]|uniref:Uncharacterized protein n=1 Tax=Lentinula lateritia TaxID=40482 RepID=A0ABQ8VAR2_9AGAR|nr:hypothetical protein C8R41DRAFT_922784 [Lentinula lateritia]
MLREQARGPEPPPQMKLTLGVTDAERASSVSALSAPLSLDPPASLPLVGSSVALQILHLASKLASSSPNTATSVARLFCSTPLKVHDQRTIAIRYTTACAVGFTKSTQRIVSRWARISIRLRRIRSSLENRDDQQLRSVESRMGSSVPMP